MPQCIYLRPEKKVTSVKVPVEAEPHRAGWGLSRLEAGQRLLPMLVTVRNHRRTMISVSLLWRIVRPIRLELGTPKAHLMGASQNISFRGGESRVLKSEILYGGAGCIRKTEFWWGLSGKKWPLLIVGVFVGRRFTPTRCLAQGSSSRS